MGREASTKNQDNFMLYIPRRKLDTWEVKGNRVYLTFRHDKLVEKLIRWLVKKPYTSDIELDDIGSAVWQLIDGSNTVYDISQKLIKEYSDKCQPVNDRLVMYLRYLNRKGWISFSRDNRQ